MILAEFFKLTNAEKNEEKIDFWCKNRSPLASSLWQGSQSSSSVGLKEPWKAPKNIFKLTNAEKNEEPWKAPKKIFKLTNAEKNEEKMGF